MEMHEISNDKQQDADQVNQTTAVSEDESEALEKHKTNIKSKKGKKKKKSKARGPTTYPTRCMKVGEIKCLFVSCFNGGRSPLLSLGPSWPFTIFLLCFACLILVYFCFMLSMAKNKESFMFICAQIGLAINLMVLLAGILKNPGIP